MRLRLQRRLQRPADGHGLPGPRPRGELHPARAEGDDGPFEQAGHRRPRRPDRRGKEPDDAQGLLGPARSRQEGRGGPPSDALRRPGQAGGPALRDPRRSEEAPVHDRGDGGVRASHRERDDPLCGRRLREDPARGGEGSRHRHLGRRQQRQLLLHARSDDHRARPAASGARTALPPGPSRTCSRPT